MTTTTKTDHGFEHQPSDSQRLTPLQLRLQGFGTAGQAEFLAQGRILAKAAVKLPATARAALPEGPCRIGRAGLRWWVLGNFDAADRAVRDVLPVSDPKQHVTLPLASEFHHPLRGTTLCFWRYNSLIVITLGSPKSSLIKARQSSPVPSAAVS